jgi:hypothetical protein
MSRDLVLSTVPVCSSGGAACLNRKLTFTAADRVSPPRPTAKERGRTPSTAHPLALSMCVVPDPSRRTALSASIFLLLFSRWRCIPEPGAMFLYGCVCCVCVALWLCIAPASGPSASSGLRHRAPRPSASSSAWPGSFCAPSLRRPIAATRQRKRPSFCVKAELERSPQEPHRYSTPTRRLSCSGM